VPHKIREWVSARNGDYNWERRLLLGLALNHAHVRVAHLVDGDFDDWAYSQRPAWMKARISATFHQPTDKLQALAAKLSPGMLDGIVCVSKDQVPLLAHLVPAGRCVFIPHGVDTEFFAPGPGAVPDARPLLLSVGTHRRDFATLLNAAKIIKARRPDARILLVGARDKVAELAATGVIETASNVSDADLRTLYARACMVFLPLEAATANNALLESMATGRPAVVTDLPAIRDYASTASAVFCPLGDAEAHAGAALALLEDADLRERMGNAAHAASAQFSWSVVRQALRGFLQQIAEGE
jgi:glycosyltransferase involved in cell wall biosynthesis